jgi:hypothetical protein
MKSSGLKNHMHHGSKIHAEARWQSPIGDAPALTQEQQDQNEAGTHMHGVISGMKKVNLGT